MKLAYSGTQGTGKTLSTYQAVLDLKHTHSDKSICAMNEIIRECPFPINAESTNTTQMWAATNQISKEIELCEKYDIVVCDRTIIDCLAYSIVYGLDEVTTSIAHLSFEWCKTYDSIFFKTIKENPYNYDDGVRNTNENLRNDVEKVMLDLYKQAQIDIIMV